MDGYIYFFKDTQNLIEDPMLCKAEPEEVCPHCGKKQSDYYCVTMEVEKGWWAEVPVGCEDCVDCAEEECYEMTRDDYLWEKADYEINSRKENPWLYEYR